MYVFFPWTAMVENGPATKIPNLTSEKAILTMIFDDIAMKATVRIEIEVGQRIDAMRGCMRANG
jgi:hypothetical protein